MAPIPSWMWCSAVSHMKAGVVTTLFFWSTWASCADVREKQQPARTTRQSVSGAHRPLLPAAPGARATVPPAVTGGRSSRCDLSPAFCSVSSGGLTTLRAAQTHDSPVASTSTAASQTRRLEPRELSHWPPQKPAPAGTRLTNPSSHPGPRIRQEVTALASLHLPCGEREHIHLRLTAHKDDRATVPTEGCRRGRAVSRTLHWVLLQRGPRGLLGARCRPSSHGIPRPPPE